MKDKLIKNYFEILGSKKENGKKFCVLKNKKSGRTIIFQKGSKDAIEFMKNKLLSPIKKLGYFFIKLNILQIFLKKIKLDPSVGQLIFVGGQTKIFDFNKKCVTSFLIELGRGWEEKFIENKKEQIELSKKGFASKIFFLNEKIPFSIEELLKEGVNISNIEVFKKLFKYYYTQKREKISYSKYIGNMEKKDSFKKLTSFLKKELRKIKEKKGTFYTLKIHGDFGKSQILLRDKEILFTDWQIREGLILEDLFGFFKEEDILFRCKKFQEILRMFPKEISNNVKEYFLVSQINLFLSNLIPYESMLKRVSAFIFYSKQINLINKKIY